MARHCFKLTCHCREGKRFLPARTLSGTGTGSVRFGSRLQQARGQRLLIAPLLLLEKCTTQWLVARPIQTSRVTPKTRFLENTTPPTACCTRLRAAGFLPTQRDWTGSI